MLLRGALGVRFSFTCQSMSSVPDKIKKMNEFSRSQKYNSFKPFTQQPELANPQRSC